MKFLSKVEHICAVGFLLFFFYPWIWIGEAKRPVFFAGYRIPNLGKELEAATFTGFGGLLLYLVYLLPILSVIIIILGIMKKDSKIPSLLAGILPVVYFSYVIGQVGIGVFKGIAPGAYLTLMTGIVMILSALNIIKTLSVDTLRALLLEISITFVLVIIFSLFIIKNPLVFARFDMYYSFMTTIPLFGTMALALTLVVTLGEMDLSFPSVLAFSAWVFGKEFEFIGNIWFAAFVCLVIGIAAGALNSLLIVKIGIPSLVATIGTMFLFRGLVNVCAQGKGISLVNARETLFYKFCVGRILLWGNLRIPAQAIWFVVLGACFWFVLNRHRFGSHVLFVGDNAESSKMMGIHVNLVKSLVFMQMGFFAAFAGILSTLEVTYFWPSQGEGYLLTTIAAVFVGGTSVFGGMGTIYGSLIGAIIIGSLEAGIVAIGLTGFFIKFIRGLFIMLSVSIYAILLKKRG